MALPIRDGNQSLTTLSTILVSNSHIPAHTVISFGAQGITDIATAVSGVELGPNTLNALENITVTLGQVTITGGLTDAQLRASAVTIGGSVTVGSIVTHGVTIANSSVTIGGSVTATIAGTPSVTFTQASVTFGTTVVTGSTSILNFPATQTVTFTQASVTFGTAVITGSTNIIGTPSVTFTQIATHGVTIANSSVTIGGTVTANAGGSFATSIEGIGDVGNASTKIAVQLYDDNGNAIGISNNPLPISGTVTVSNISSLPDGADNAVIRTFMFGYDYLGDVPVAIAANGTAISVAGSVAISSAIPTGTNRIGVVTIGGGTVTIGAGTSQIGSVTASISNTVTIFPVQGTSVTTSNFTSTTPSQTIASASSGREILTIFNEGAGNLHVCAGSTCTTIGYQVRLSSGDYWECPTSQVQLIHTAVFATAGTARVTEVG
jgi:hypothetical protein